MFNWNKKEAPLKALAGLGGGVGRGSAGAQEKPVDVYIYGGKSSNGGRGGDSPYGGYTHIAGTVTVGTSIAYICGRSSGNQGFYYGGPGGGPNGNGGGFSAVWVSDGAVSPNSRNTNYLIAVAGGSGAGGNDGYNNCRGGYGGGGSGGICPEEPNQGLAGHGGGQNGGGSGGGGGGSQGGQWVGGPGGPENCGGGGGGWHGGGGGGTNGSYDAGGGGGSGYTGPNRTVENPHGKFVITGSDMANGGYPGPGAPSPVTSAYPHTGQGHPATTGRVYIVVDGVEVHDGQSNPTTAAATYTII